MGKERNHNIWISPATLGITQKATFLNMYISLFIQVNWILFIRDPSQHVPFTYLSIQRTRISTENLNIKLVKGDVSFISRHSPVTIFLILTFTGL